MKKFFLSSLFVMTTYLVYGQSFGTVLDEFGQPIDQVSVFFADQNIMLMSDVNGQCNPILQARVFF